MPKFVRMMMCRRTATSPLPPAPSQEERARIAQLWPTSDDAPDENVDTRLSTSGTLEYYDPSYSDELQEHVQGLLQRWRVSKFTWHYEGHWDDRWNQVMVTILIKAFYQVRKHPVVCQLFSMNSLCGCHTVAGPARRRGGPRASPGAQKQLQSRSRHLQALQSASGRVSCSAQGRLVSTADKAGTEHRRSHQNSSESWVFGPLGHPFRNYSLPTMSCRLSRRSQHS